MRSKVSFGIGLSRQRKKIGDVITSRMAIDSAGEQAIDTQAQKAEERTI